ncbi:TolC family protein [Paenibacillus turpanensis]|uniref:TolC family protein n=1 Tax=Paenibacillus turpanensis TaxID=2689078 RepID=UPI001FB6D406|nr:TolC family protein [Paenibacillus turpanensis]
MKTRISAASALLLFLTALLIVPSGIAAAADEVDYYGEWLSEQDKKAQQFPVSEMVHMDEIDLETVLQRATEVSNNIKLLTLKSSYLKAKSSDVNIQASELSTGEARTVTLPTTAEQFMGSSNYTVPKPEVWMGPVAETNTVVTAVVYGQAKMVSGMNRLIEKQRFQMIVTAKQVDSESINAQIQQNEAAKGVRLQMTGQYATLLSLKKQEKLMEQYLELLTSKVKAAKVKLQYGLASEDDVTNAERALQKQQDDLAVVKNNVLLSLAQLSFDLGIEYNPDLKVADLPEATLEPVERADVETLVEKSFAMQMAYVNLNQAGWEKSFTTDPNFNGREALNTNIALQRGKIAQLRVDLQKKIEAVYTEADNLYEAYRVERRNRDDAHADYEKMKIRFENGVIAKHDLEQLAFKVTQADTMLELASIKYAVAVEKEKAMEQGLIP